MAFDQVRVSTHSRLKAAGTQFEQQKASKAVSTHSRLKAAGSDNIVFSPRITVSTHSRLKAAGWFQCYLKNY